MCRVDSGAGATDGEPGGGWQGSLGGPVDVFDPSSGSVDPAPASLGAPDLAASNLL